jgi:hypothetical protein
MCPVSLLAGCQLKLVFFLTALLSVMGEKLGTDPQTSQPVCCGLDREPFFSGAVDLFKFVNDYAKCCSVLTA